MATTTPTGAASVRQIGDGRGWRKRHEQNTIIADDYDDIRNRSPITWALTMAMSYTAESPIHRGDPFREVVPYEVRTPVLDTPDRVPLLPSWMPGDPVYLDTPDRVGGTIDELPINNVTIREYRWQWIIGDMFPKYMELVNAGQAGGYIATPLEELAAERRNIPDWLLEYQPGG